jgi:hypothetical protein
MSSFASVRNIDGQPLRSALRPQSGGDRSSKRFGERSSVGFAPDTKPGLFDTGSSSGGFDFGDRYGGDSRRGPSFDPSTYNSNPYLQPMYSSWYDHPSIHSAPPPPTTTPTTPSVPVILPDSVYKHLPAARSARDKLMQGPNGTFYASEMTQAIDEIYKDALSSSIPDGESSKPRFSSLRSRLPSWGGGITLPKGMTADEKEALKDDITKAVLTAFQEDNSKAADTQTSDASAGRFQIEQREQN